MPISGKSGVIAGVKQIRNWNIDDGFSDVPYSASNLKHGTGRAPGIYDWTGSWDQYIGTPVHMPGTIVSAVQFYKGPDGTGDLYQGDVYVESVVINWNFQTNENISVQTSFGGSGALTKTPAQTAILDTAAPDFPTPCNGKVVLHDGADPGVETIVENVTTAVLTITRAAQTAVNSGTTSGAGKCQTERVNGSPLDWTLALSTEKESIVTALEPGNDVIIRLYINATDYFELKWGRMINITGLQVDVEGGAIVAQTHNLGMQASSGGTLGRIRLPGAPTTDWWPIP